MRLSRRLLRAMLRISAPDSLFDQPLRIQATDLRPKERYVVKSRVEHRGSSFEAVATYEADASGSLDCARDPSLGGSFHGVEPMGLFWALQAIPGSRKGAILMPHSVEPMDVELSLFRGEDTSGNLLDEAKLRRHFVHPGVERTQVSAGRLRGAFFRPSDTGGRRLPAILDIYGTGGGLPQPRAALMASKGFAVLSLAVFAYEDLPRHLRDGVDVEYFQEGLDWLQAQDSVDPERLGMIGCSFGAIISIITATFDPRIKAVASVNGFHLLDSLTPLNYKGRTLDNLCGDTTLKEPSPGGSLSYRVYRKSILHCEDDVLPVEKTDAALLFLVGAEDAASPTDASSAAMMARLARHGRADQGRRLVYPGSGHLLEPPYTPHAARSWHSVLGAFMLWGGEARAHNKAQEQMWTQLQAFWTTHLGTPAQMPPPRFAAPEGGGGH